MDIKTFSSTVKFNELDRTESNLAFLDDANLYLNQIKRVYSVFNIKRGTVRGHHAHLSLKQLLFCPSGSILLTLYDGRNQIEVILDHPSKFLYVGPKIWGSYEVLLDNSILVVLASENYDEKDYIRDYDEFLRIIDNETNPL